MTAPGTGSGDGAPGRPEGILNLLKPPGMTSHDVVAFVRRLLGERRIGHGGTLDPGAAGVLPLCVGRSTRLTDMLQAMPKVYRVEMTLGVSTDTHDQYGETTDVVSNFALSLTDVAEALDAFTGRYEQVPPMTSALRHRGVRLYALARQGVNVPRAARPVTIYRIRIVRALPADTDTLTFGSRIYFDVACSSGTYVRTLCHDVGQRLGCGAHMSFLIRTRVGPFAIDDALTLEDLSSLVSERRAAEAFLSPTAALVHLPAVYLPPEEARRFRFGQPVPWSGPVEAGRKSAFGEIGSVPEQKPGETIVRVHGSPSRLLGLGRMADADGQRWIRPYKVLQPPQE